MVHVRERAEMRQQLRDSDPQGVMALDYPVGSDASASIEQAFKNIVKPRVDKYGVASWLQQSRFPREGMNTAPQYHPEIGLNADRAGTIRFDQEKFIETAGEVIGGTLDLDLKPNASRGYHTMLAHAFEMQHARVVKTQIASPHCARGAWPQGTPDADVEMAQEAVYPALLRGHINRLRRAFPAQPIIVSVDDPGSLSGEAALTNFEIMRFQDAQAVLRGYHNCGGAAMFPLMQSGQVDVIHFESPAHDGLFRGNSEAVREYVERGGMFAIGAVRQNEQGLLGLARTLGFKFDESAVRSYRDYNPVARFLRKRHTDAAARIAQDFRTSVYGIAQESDFDPSVVARASFLSTTCGLGGVRNPFLRRQAYALLNTASNMIRNDKWKR